MKRFFFFTFIITALSLGILWCLPIKIICFALLGVFLLFEIIFKKQYLIILSVLLAVICLAVSAVSFKEYSSIEKAQIKGEIIAVSENRLILNDTVITKDDKNISSKKCYIYTSAKYEVGDVISCTADLSPVARIAQNLGDKDTRFSYCAENISYSGYGSDFTLLSHKNDVYTFFNTIRTSIYSRLSLIMEDENTLSSLYGMICGDRSRISDELSDSYANAGVSHLLAVSGFHISLLLGILTYILDKFKFKGLLKLIPISAFLVFYAFLTGFPPSVIRASIMALAVVFSSGFGFRYDPLNMLCLAGMGILLISPFELFDVSFQLSFCACFGIIAFYKHFDGFFGKILGSVIITVSATCATLPIVLYQFGSVSSVTVISNLIVVPITSLALTMLVIVLVPVMISSFFLPLSLPAYYVAYVANKLIYLFGSIPEFFSAINNGFIAVGLLIFIIFISKYCHIQKKIKLLVSIVLIITIAALSGINIINRNSQSEIRVLYTDNNSLCVHIHQKNDYIIGYDNSYCETRYVSRNLPKIDGVFILCDSDIDGYKEIGNISKIKNIYSTEGYDYEVLSNENKIICEEKFSIDKSEFLISEQGILYSYLGKTVFIGANDQTYCCENDVDVNISNKYLSKNGANITNLNDEQFEFSSQNQGCITIYITKDGITITPFHEVK